LKHRLVFMLKPRLKKEYTSDFEVSGKRWNQNRLTAKLQLAGWDTSQGSLSRLENGERRVPDLELFVLADVLGAKLEDFFPKNLRGKVKALWPLYRMKFSRGQLPPKQ
jgi:transcriptional regulator with XRE-family HTH domain